VCRSSITSPVAAEGSYQKRKSFVASHRPYWPQWRIDRSVFSSLSRCGEVQRTKELAIQLIGAHHENPIPDNCAAALTEWILNLARSGRTTATCKATIKLRQFNPILNRIAATTLTLTELGTPSRSDCLCILFFTAP
jgi:hypothetical protein